jgi:acyl-CoA thioesterase FadM
MPMPELREAVGTPEQPGTRDRRNPSRHASRRLPHPTPGVYKTARMLGYLARTLPAALRARLGRDGRLVSRIERRVRLSEVDINGHMNQAAYAQVLELGRLDWVVRSGAWAAWRRDRIGPVVAEQRIVYRRELAPRQRYAIDTRVVRVEGRLLAFEGHILVGDRVHAKSEAKLIFVGPDGVLSPEAVEARCARYLVETLAVDDWRVRRAAQS